MVDPKLLAVCIVYIVCFDVLDIKDFYYQIENMAIQNMARLK